MPLQIIQNQITEVHADAIVNASDPWLSGHDGVDQAIQQAAGPELSGACRALGGCAVGEAVITGAYRLPAKYIIHTAVPRWSTATNGSEDHLAACYGNALGLAREHQLESIAFPLLGTGPGGFPKAKALRVAISVIGNSLRNHDMMVFLVVPDRAAFALPEGVSHAITRYLADRYEEAPLEQDRHGQTPVELESASETTDQDMAEMTHLRVESPIRDHQRSLEDVVNRVDESFSQMLLRLIAEKGMTESQAYKKANVDRRHFSKIRNDIGYRPTKPTVLAFAIALELSLDETQDLLLRAGFALSHSSRFDLIIRYFIEEGIYDVFEINEALYFFEQDLLGF